MEIYRKFALAIWPKVDNVQRSMRNKINPTVKIMNILLSVMSCHEKAAKMLRSKVCTEIDYGKWN